MDKLLFLLGGLDRLATTYELRRFPCSMFTKPRLYLCSRSRFLIVYRGRLSRSGRKLSKHRSARNELANVSPPQLSRSSPPKLIFESDERSRRSTKYRSPSTCSHVQRAPHRVSTIRECVNIRYRLASFAHVFGRSRAFCAHRLHGNWRAYRLSPVIPLASFPNPASRIFAGNVSFPAGPRGGSALFLSRCLARTFARSLARGTFN